MNPSTLFPGFRTFTCTTNRVRFAGVVGGSGPAVLLLHGYPETHAAWHAVAPVLSRHHTVIVPDLPGYGGSDLLDAGPWHKRAVAAEAVAMMEKLNHGRFAVVGHDRGARVGYRLALDHGERVDAYCSIAVVPTLDVWPAVDRAFAKWAFHWFLFAQPGDLPERLLASDPDAFLHATLDHMAGGVDRLAPLAVADYVAAFRRPSVRAAIIEDYRAADGLDVEHDAADRAAGRRIGCPLLVLWPSQQRLVAEPGTDGAVDAAAVWRRWADDVRQVDVDGGHLLPEQAARAVTDALLRFLGATIQPPTPPPAS